MQTTQSLMDEISAAFQFFDGFGANWIALRECLEYLDEWLPADAYILLCEQAESILFQEQTSDLTAFLMTLNEVGSWWSKPITDNGRFNRKCVPFHVLLYVTENDREWIGKISTLAANCNVPLRYMNDET